MPVLDTTVSLLLSTHSASTSRYLLTCSLALMPFMDESLGLAFKLFKVSLGTQFTSIRHRCKNITTTPYYHIIHFKVFCFCFGGGGDGKQRLGFYQWCKFLSIASHLAEMVVGLRMEVHSLNSFLQQKKVYSMLQLPNQHTLLPRMRERVMRLLLQPLPGLCQQKLQISDMYKKLVQACLQFKVLLCFT